MASSFFWYDYETFGIDPARDRIAQFAGIRTDMDLETVGDPVVAYCKIPADSLPHPAACAVHNIPPQITLEKGLIEARFAKTVFRELNVPETCISGYNILDFDEEFTRYLFYRNLLEPYSHQSEKIKNSRWDLVNIVRLMWAIRPECISWPINQGGDVTTKLELLTKLNGISHEAHDALADVRATISLFKILRKFDPKLMDFLFQNRTKDAATKLLNIKGKNFRDARPVLHISSTYSAKNKFAAIVLPICQHPQKKNYIIACNLQANLKPLLELPARELKDRIFEGSGEERPGLHSINLTKCPVFLPLALLGPRSLERLGVDLDLCDANEKLLKSTEDMAYVAAQTFKKTFEDESDPDLMLYGGGFFSDSDRDKLAALVKLPIFDPGKISGHFDDPRLPEMIFRYKARNWPNMLTTEEQIRWAEFRRNRLTGADGTNHLTLTDFTTELLQSKENGMTSDMVTALLTYQDELITQLCQTDKLIVG